MLKISEDEYRLEAFSTSRPISRPSVSKSTLTEKYPGVFFTREPENFWKGKAMKNARRSMQENDDIG
jgi:hypothetical protein